MAPAKRTDAETRELRVSLLEHARRLVAREGAAALTMRALATEAGCAVGLPYKVFANRNELVAELVAAEFERLAAAFAELVAGAGTGTVAGALVRYADLLLDSPALALMGELHQDGARLRALGARAVESGLAPALVGTVVEYLAAEKRLGRVAADVDEDAFGFVIAGAVHNLLVSGEQYPRPTRDRLERMLAAVAARLAPIPPTAEVSREEDE